MERQTFVNDAGKLLAEYGFEYIKSSNVFVKSVGGSASSCVKFLYISDLNFESILDPLYNATDFPRNICTEFVFIQDYYKIDSAKLEGLLETMKKNGFVGDIILVDIESSEIQLVGRRVPMTRGVLECLKNAINGTVTVKKAHKITYYGRKNYWLLYVLIGINVLVFLAGLLSEQIFGYDYIKKFGILYAPLVFYGERWRLVTSIFLHADIVHLAGNMFTLHYFGRMVLGTYKKTSFLLVYFLAGIFGNVLSLFFVDGLSLGASGAIMGLGGVIIYKILLSREKKIYRSTGNYIYMGFLVLYNLLYGVFNTGENINNFGHFGGFIAGFLIALIIEKIAIRREE